MFIISFGNPLCCVFSECRRGEYSFKMFGSHSFLMISVVSSIFVFDFVIVFKFFYF